MSNYRKNAAADDRELSAVRLAQAVLEADDVVESHRKELLGIAVWNYTEARSTKYGLRYRTPAALAAGPDIKLQHEHVRTRAAIVDDLIAADPRLAPLVLSTAVGCVVTKEEHAVLTALPKELQGWARYSAAGFYVVDGATGQTVDPVGLERYYGRLDLDEARRLSPGGGARLCLLAACRLLEEDTDAEWLHRAVRDADSAETCWMHRRFAERGGNRESAEWAELLGDLHEAGRRFGSRALVEAGGNSE